MRAENTLKGICIFLLLVLLPFGVSGFAPSAPTNMTNLSQSAPEPASGLMENNSGGTITVYNINATTQNYRWKGFVGNISGTLSLQDSSLQSLYSWEVTDITGEIYATKNSSILNWENIACAGDGLISKEEYELNITSSSVDSIKNTFSSTTHRKFFSGLNEINENSCYAIALNVNNTAQNDNFQEVLLSDGTNLIYASLLENSTYGFNNQSYDFQMIVPDNALEEEDTNVAYYFYVELV